MNFSDHKLAFQSVFMCHNETVNVWTMVFGVLTNICIIAIFYITISNHPSADYSAPSIFAEAQAKQNFTHDFSLTVGEYLQSN